MVIVFVFANIGIIFGIAIIIGNYLFNTYLDQIKIKRAYSKLRPSVLGYIKNK